MVALRDLAAYDVPTRRTGFFGERGLGDFGRLYPRHVDVLLRVVDLLACEAKLAENALRRVGKPRASEQSLQRGGFVAISRVVTLAELAAAGAGIALGDLGAFR